jgi:hypothetical protein
VEPGGGVVVLVVLGALTGGVVVLVVLGALTGGVVVLVGRVTGGSSAGR